MIYVVSGLLRTGTSMMMHALIKGGIPAIYDVGKDITIKSRMTEDYDPNLNGTFELTYAALIKRFPDDLDGEAVKIHDTTWMALKHHHAPNGMAVVYMTRRTEDILASLQRMIGKEGLVAQQVLRATMEFQLAVAESVRKRKDVKTLTIMRYEDVLDDPRKCFELLKKEGFPIDVDRAVSVVKPDACHYRGTEMELPEMPDEFRELLRGDKKYEARAIEDEEEGEQDG